VFLALPFWCGVPRSLRFLAVSSRIFRAVWEVFGTVSVGFTVFSWNQSNSAAMDGLIADLRSKLAHVKQGQRTNCGVPATAVVSNI
jgi:hypothetical protein